MSAIQGAVGFVVNVTAWMWCDGEEGRGMECCGWVSVANRKVKGRQADCGQKNGNNTYLLPYIWPGYGIVSHAIDVEGEKEARDHVVGRSDSSGFDEEVIKYIFLRCAIG